LSKGKKKNWNQSSKHPFSVEQKIIDDPEIDEETREEMRKRLNDIMSEQMGIPVSKLFRQFAEGVDGGVIDEKALAKLMYEMQAEVDIDTERYRRDKERQYREMYGGNPFGRGRRGHPSGSSPFADHPGYHHGGTATGRFEHERRPVDPYDDLTADIQIGIELHEDVEEFLEATDHSVKITILRDESWCLVEYIEKHFAFAEFQDRIRESDMYRAQYKDQVLYHNHVRRADLAYEPEKAMKVIQDTVDKNRGKYDRSPVRPEFDGTGISFGDEPHKVKSEGFTVNIDMGKAEERVLQRMIVDDPHADDPMPFKHPFEDGDKPVEKQDLKIVECDHCRWQEPYDMYQQRIHMRGHCTRCGHFLEDKHPLPENDNE